KAGVSMMVDLKVMAYFKISLSTRNWDRAFFFVAAAVPDRPEWLDYRGVIPLFFNILTMNGY
ncbi:hypothetical protein MPE84_20255, partial [Aeromonas veronii]|uniref:hypothetical protein n=1 Tax=Aeromonas veronii TaxID=654 RepID=UPI001FD6CEE7